MGISEPPLYFLCSTKGFQSASTVATVVVARMQKGPDEFTLQNSSI